MDGTNISATGPQESTNRMGHRTVQSANSAQVWDTRQLFQGAREVRVRHGGIEYRLQITRNDKLILIK